MRDGAVEVLFRPRLNAQHYAELATLIEQPTTKEELCETVRNWAKKHGLVVLLCEDAI